MPPFQDEPSRIERENARELLYKKVLEKLVTLHPSQDKEDTEKDPRSEIEKIVLLVMEEEKTKEKYGENIPIAFKNYIISKILEEKTKQATSPQPKKIYDIVPPTTPKTTKPTAKPWWKADDDRPELKRNDDGTYTQINDEK